MGFQSDIVISPVLGQGRFWIVKAPLVYVSAAGRRFEVPEDFVCDLNSMPRLTWIVSPKTDYPAAGALHDYLYRFGRQLGVDRAQADALYREALISLGMSSARAQSRYLALRAFGWASYK